MKAKILVNFQIGISVPLKSQSTFKKMKILKTMDDAVPI